MNTLAAAPRLVKSARSAGRSFGAGLAPERKRRPEPTAADRAWAAAALNVAARDYCLAGQSAPPVGLTSAQMDELAMLEESMARYERGFAIL